MVEELEQLIERLHQLHLQRENISAEERNILHTILSDRVQDSTVVATTTAVATVAANPAATVAPVFRIGQQVYITNRINHVLVRRATEADRTAIVTHFTASRVAIRTINGYHTYRHPKNLRPL